MGSSPTRFVRALYDKISQGVREALNFKYVGGVLSNTCDT